MMFFKSKLYRDEIKHWILTVVLIGWGTVSTYFALKNREKLILIGINDSGARLITESNDQMLQYELKSFLETFIKKYYSYSESTFSTQISEASDLMSESLWEQKKAKLLELQEKLKKSPLVQDIEILGIDKVDDSKIEATATVIVRSKLSEQKYNVRINLSYTKIKRSEANPWGYQIEEVTDVTN